MRFSPLHALLFLLLSGLAHAEPITTRSDTVGMLLNEWSAAGTAAGLTGITYENRDGQHSMLDANLFPQLKIVVSPDNDRGPARTVRSEPTIGNCSMASPPEQMGSLPRMYMSDPEGGRFLAQQFLMNNLFIYPEHLDHDPGSGGVGGYGDLFPLNTPALLTSQGSSGTDKPFLQALLSTTAAFTPETRKLLIEKKLLAPTLQAIFRRSNKMVVSDADYLTAKAHPVVFDGSQIDEEKMIRMAHGMTPDTIPPLPIIDVIEETNLENGVHFFEPASGTQTNWKIATSPVSVGRIFRGNVSQYGMIVSLAKSFAATSKKIGVRFALLQGDPRFVTIEQQPGTAVARIRVRWQPPITGARGIRSHRIDIGAFATDGTSFSAPAIISFYMLPNELHFYDNEGRVSEIHYQTFNPEIGLPEDDKDLRWARIMQIVSSDNAGSDLLQRSLATSITTDERAAIHKLQLAIQKQLNAAATVARDPKLKAEADELRAVATKSIATALETTLPGEKPCTTRLAIRTALETLFADPLFYIRQQQEISPLAARSTKSTAAADVRAELQRLTSIGILRATADGTVQTISDPQKLSLGERLALRGLNLTVLSQVLMSDALERSPKPAWVPPRLTSDKPWRDVMHYDPASGQLTGWTRHHHAQATEFDAQGRLIPASGQGVPIPVTYVIDTDGSLTWRIEKR